MKAERPHLKIVLNGGLPSLEAAAAHLSWADGVMLGRAAYEQPWRLATVDSAIFGEADPVATRHEAAEAYLPYVERELGLGTPLAAITRHMLGLFAGRPGGRLFRRHLAENAHLKGAGINVLRDALTLVSPSSLEDAA